MDDKTLTALKWIVGILNKQNVKYQIAGGFAAKIYGSPRTVNDIDFDIHDSDFSKILSDISKYIIFGPARYKNEKWDTELITLNYHGQEIDISGADTIRMSNLDKTAWISYEKSDFNSIPINIEGIEIEVIHPQELIDYKKELDGEHQSEDIKAEEDYIRNTSGI